METNIVHKDYLGRELAIGDEVVFSSMETAKLKIGKIIKVTTARISVQTSRGVTIKSPEDVVKNPDVWEIL